MWHALRDHADGRDCGIRIIRNSVDSNCGMRKSHTMVETHRIIWNVQDRVDRNRGMRVIRAADERDHSI
jgi:hypothetical protein